LYLGIKRNERTSFFCRRKWNAVFPLFKKYIFENTSEIALKSFTLEETQDGVSLKLIVEENKNNFEKIARFLFEESTFFQFTDKAPLK